MSKCPLYDEVSQFAQTCDCLQADQCCLRIVVQLVGKFARARHAQQTDVSGFVVGGVFACGFAECGGRRLGIEYVINHLKRQADTFCVMVKLGQAACSSMSPQ